MVGAKLLHSSLALLTLRSRALSAFALPLSFSSHNLLFSSLRLTHSAATAVRVVWLKKVALKVQLPGPGLDIDYAPLSLSLSFSLPTCGLSRSLSHCICIIYVLAVGSTWTATATATAALNVFCVCFISILHVLRNFRC